MFFPKYSNIYPELKEVLYNRAAQTTNVYQLGGVSGLSSWIRIISSVEIDAINGMVVTLGKEHNVETPYNTAVSSIIKAQEADF